ncbi:MAG: BON domain-containing protein [Geminicoccaceae bacterium]
MRSFSVLVCLIVLALTGYSAIVFKAPKIQDDIRARVEQALSDGETASLEVIVDGRDVTLRGSVSDDRQQRELVQRVSAVRGVLGPIDRLERLTVMSPYRFEATKSEDGDVVVEGFAPSVEIRDLMSADAQTVFGTDAEVRIDLAAGAPEGDWRGIAGLGMDALATLDHGKIMIADTDVSLAGDLDNAVDVEAVEIFADAAPEGFNWTHDLSVAGQTTAAVDTIVDTAGSEAARPVKPFTFTIEKHAEGSLNMRGYAPDEGTRQAMIDQAKAVAGDHPIIAEIVIADGMPNANWPELIFAGIGAMAQIDEGKYDVVDDDVSFTGDVAGDIEPDASEDPIVEGEDEAGQTVELEAEVAEVGDDLDPVPPARPYAMTIYNADNGDHWAEGVAPDIETRDGLIAALKENFAVDDFEAEIELADGVPGEDWQEFVADRAFALTAVKSGSLSIEDYDVHLIGVVDTPEDIDTVQTKLAAIDDAMTVDLNPIDPRPAATLELVVSSKNGVTLWGTLPGDMTENDVADALGLQAYQGGLEGGGRGNAEDWQQRLAELGAYLPQFESVGITFADDHSRISGKVFTGGNIDQLTEKLSNLLDGNREPAIDISVTQLSYENDARRKNPLNGR